jgi:glycosyltransferase involved in cell wall biosynthesis
VKGAKKAERIIVPSNYSLGTISNYLQLPKQHFRVVYEAGKSLEKKIKSPATHPIAGLEGTPYFLHVGAFNQHKNLVRLIEAFEMVRQAHPQALIHLILVGQAGGSVFSDDSLAIKAAIKKYGLSNFVHLPGYMSDEDVSTLYQHALAYVFPSYNEGFGLPALEAMAFQLPVIAANNTCLPEICKDGAIYFDPFNIAEMALQMGSLLNNESERKRIVEKQKTVAANYSWQKSAKEIMQVFTEIAELKKN